ncbi:hypothetical protein KIN20_018556 [Parelaphostrongylus tenuis]|uniref:Uncharacterized protein n=1 Tax=Parelaphostrongylus tenuis TaxID=148309 RepID=A0AAD5N7N5_PARTN|nr:hypothetical protein KIN20_018556 [Parelaphostrongylus tenuis]
MTLTLKFFVSCNDSLAELSHEIWSDSQEQVKKLELEGLAQASFQTSEVRAICLLSASAVRAHFKWSKLDEIQ